MIEEILSEFSWDNKSDYFVSKLSGGQENLLALALALLGSPKLFILDERTYRLFRTRSKRDFFGKNITV